MFRHISLWSDYDLFGRIGFFSLICLSFCQRHYSVSSGSVFLSVSFCVGFSELQVSVEFPFVLQLCMLILGLDICYRTPNLVFGPRLFAYGVLFDFYFSVSYQCLRYSPLFLFLTYVFCGVFSTVFGTSILSYHQFEAEFLLGTFCYNLG